VTIDPKELNQALQTTAQNRIQNSEVIIENGIRKLYLTIGNDTVAVDIGKMNSMNHITDNTLNFDLSNPKIQVRWQATKTVLAFANIHHDRGPFEDPGGVVASYADLLATENGNLLQYAPNAEEVGAVFTGMSIGQSIVSFMHRQNDAYAVQVNFTPNTDVLDITVAGSAEYLRDPVDGKRHVIYRALSQVGKDIFGGKVNVNDQAYVHYEDRFGQSYTKAGFLTNTLDVDLKLVRKKTINLVFSAFRTDTRGLGLTGDPSNGLYPAHTTYFGLLHGGF